MERRGDVRVYTAEQWETNKLIMLAIGTDQHQYSANRTHTYIHVQSHTVDPQGYNELAKDPGQLSRNQITGESGV